MSWRCHNIAFTSTTPWQFSCAAKPAEGTSHGLQRPKHGEDGVKMGARISPSFRLREALGANSSSNRVATRIRLAWKFVEISRRSRNRNPGGFQKQIAAWKSTRRSADWSCVTIALNKNCGYIYFPLFPWHILGCVNLEIKVRSVRCELACAGSKWRNNRRTDLFCIF